MAVSGIAAVSGDHVPFRAITAIIPLSSTTEYSILNPAPVSIRMRAASDWSIRALTDSPWRKPLIVSIFSPKNNR